MLTGESMPVEKKVGDAVIGATINKSGTFQYRATKVGADTALAQIVKLVQEAQNSKAPAQLLADRAAQWLVLAAIVVGLLTFVVWYWWIGQTLLFALTLTITVFVIACPDALGLATPMAIMVGTGLGAMNGILFKNASALEDATKLDVIIFDKTGTLTMGQPEVVDLALAAGATEEALLTAAAAVEAGSDHPLAQAILRRAADLKPPKASGFENLEGKGARAEIDGKTVLLGNKLLMTESKIDLGELGAKSEELQGAGRTVVHLAVDGKLLGLIAIADAVRPTAVEAVKALRARGVEVAMLTGDNLGHGQADRGGPRDRHGVRRRAARRQGEQGQGAAGPGQEGRHGRRRRQRRPGPDPGRRRLRDRRRHGRRDGERRHRPDEERPVRRGRRHRAVPRDAAERCIRTSGGRSATTSSPSRWRPACCTPSCSGRASPRWPCPAARRWSRSMP